MRHIIESRWGEFIFSEGFSIVPTALYKAVSQTFTFYPKQKEELQEKSD